MLIYTYPNVGIYKCGLSVATCGISGAFCLVADGRIDRLQQLLRIMETCTLQKIGQTMLIGWIRFKHLHL